VEESDRWQPDEGLVFTVRTRSVAISTLSGPDRAWVVAALTAQGWTVSAIADRLLCSLRLIQQIKAEPMTKVALHALSLAQDLANERGMRHIEGRLAGLELAGRDREIARLSRQRDVLLDRIALLQQKGASNGSIRNPAA
jgi:hypothetical protein